MDLFIVTTKTASSTHAVPVDRDRAICGTLRMGGHRLALLDIEGALKIRGLCERCRERLEDMETCSWCAAEVPDSTLKELETGERVCRVCAAEIAGPQILSALDD